MSEATVTRAPRRADAQRNYEIILATARAAIAERGGNIVLEDIARDAGVGIGTLYRHFPTRQDLSKRRSSTKRSSCARAHSPSRTHHQPSTHSSVGFACSETLERTDEVWARR